MIPIRSLLSIFGLAVVWMLFGQPDIRLPGNQLLLAFAVIYILSGVWPDASATLFSGDRYTYRWVFIAINAIVSAIGLIAIAIAFHKNRGHFPSLSDVNIYFIAFLIILLFVMISPVLFSTKNPDLLPRKTERRIMADPGKGDAP